MRTGLAFLAGTAVALMVAVSPALAQKQGGTLRISHRDNPPSASVHEEATISVNMPFMSVFNNLVMFDPKEKINSADKIVPDLAESWSWNGDNTKLTFKLRPGVKWHDGKPFSSNDVKCTWDALRGDEKQDIIRKNPRKVWYKNLKEVTTNGDNEVTFHLERVQPSFMSMLAAGYSPVYPCHVDSRTMRSKPIGTGPFKVADFKRNESIKLVRNTDYWKKGQPLLDAIDFKIVPNRSTRVLGFVAGEFDLTFDSDITFPLLKDVKGQKADAICEPRPTNVHQNLLVNRDAPPFDNPKLREALVYAIDRKPFSDILSQGNDLRGATMLPPPAGVWGMTQDELQKLPGFGPDIEKNRAEAQTIMKAQADLHRGRTRADRHCGLVQQDPAEELPGRSQPDRRRSRRSRRRVLRELLQHLRPQLHGLQEPRGRQDDRSSVDRDGPRQACRDGGRDRTLPAPGCG